MLKKLTKTSITRSRAYRSAGNMRSQRRIVKIAPGEKAEFWNECLSGGYMCVGWADVGDLREFDSKEKFSAKFAKTCAKYHHGNKSKLTTKANELWILRQLKPGDLIVANQGTQKVLAVGTVVRPGYEFCPEDTNGFNHHVRVRWDVSYEQDIPPQGNWRFVTIGDVPSSLYSKILAPGGGALVNPPRNQAADSVTGPTALPGKGGGFGSYEQNLKVESKAVSFVTKRLTSEGWDVESVERLKCGYDLRCKRGCEELHAEVKGTSGDTPNFIITAKEFNNAKEDKLFRLYVVLNALSGNRSCREMTGAEFLKRYDLSVLQYMARISAEATGPS